jgi:hypothetical protein
MKLKTNLLGLIESHQLSSVKTSLEIYIALLITRNYASMRKFTAEETRKGGGAT